MHRQLLPIPHVLALAAARESAAGELLLDVHGQLGDALIQGIVNAALAAVFHGDEWASNTEVPETDGVNECTPTMTETAEFVDELHDPDLRSLYEYWDRLRRGRAMPQRADIDPTEIPKLLPYIFMYDVASKGSYTIRLAGEELVRSAGSNPKGQPAGSTMTPDGSERLIKLLDMVTTERAPKFRAGKDYWRPNGGSRDFELCLLPLSADGEKVNVIFGGLKIKPGY